MKGQITRHNFFHMGDYRGGVRCIHCDVERVFISCSIGFRWILKDVEHVKKPKCITRQLNAPANRDK
jgi:hypothetical protein